MATANMPRSYKAACSHRFVADLDPPELATNEDWRGIMQRARKAYKVDGKAMTQDQLAERVGRRIRERWPNSTVETPSQALISKIESGDTKSSKVILAICDVLSIPAPEHTADEEDRSWIRLGRVIRGGDPDEFKHLLATLEKIAAQVSKEETEPGPQPEPQPKLQ
jgi:transcriptional regulator with XRE-family HTH domain